ncbi:MAG TPA: tetratricopeptide repeat protein, partial [Anaerolineales bacterium]
AEIFNIPHDERAGFLRFARGDWKSAPVQSGEQPSWRAPTKVVRSNIPATTTSLIAREEEIALIREYLSKDDIRLVTLMGPPGIGKTRLSIEAARASLHDFPDGVFFVALAFLDDPNSIASAIIQALGYMESGDNAPEDQLKESIAQKQMLIVLDNCEHVIEGIASIASRLLSACPHLKMLATSRESFRIPGEWLYPVPAFDIPTESETIDLDNASNFPALMLFFERARAVRPDFKLTADNIQTIAAICAHLDGLPLVIELIAARMRLMSPQALLERLSAQFVLTADGMRAPSERQKTLRNAIDWSYKLLSAPEQKLFVYLSVFLGGFALEDAEAIFARSFTEKSVPELLALLLDKSLIRRVANESSEDHYEMLVTIQEYARERLGQLGEETEIRNLHLAYFLNFARQGGQGMRGPNQVEWLHRLNAARDNLRTALDWAIEIKQTEVALQLVRNLHWFWFVHSDHTEARRALGLALALLDVQKYPESQAEVLTQLAHHTWTQIGAEEARPLVEQALSIARARDDKPNIARSLSILGLVLVMQRKFAEAQSNLEESKALFQEVGDKWEYAHTVMSLALGAYEQNNLALSLSLHEQALALFREVGDSYFQSFALDFIGSLQVKQGDVKRGMTALREALILARRLDSKHGIAGAISRLAAVAQRVDDPARAVHLYWAARNVWASIGVWRDDDEIDFENWLAPCRAALGEAAFAAAEAQGRAMMMEQAIAYALEKTDV